MDLWIVALIILSLNEHVKKIKSRKIIENEELIECFKHEKSFLYFVIFITFIITSFLIYMIYIDFKNILNWLFLGIYIIYLVTFLKNYLSSIFIYENGLIINGRYIKWESIKNIKKEVYSTIALELYDYGYGTALYRVGSSGIEGVNTLFDIVDEKI